MFFVTTFLSIFTLLINHFSTHDLTERVGPSPGIGVCATTGCHS